MQKVNVYSSKMKKNNNKKNKEIKMLWNNESASK